MKYPMLFRMTFSVITLEILLKLIESLGMNRMTMPQITFELNKIITSYNWARNV